MPKPSQHKRGILRKHFPQAVEVDAQGIRIQYETKIKGDKLAQLIANLK